uniref:ORF29 n=1 Tax=Nitrosopumilaceae spindle-shaped virus TaxID=3065433 RepID=A0AAT9JGL2_9VIRU
MIKNRNYDPKLFIVSRHTVDVALLPGVGRFCKCGCGNKIDSRRVTRIRNGKAISYILKPDPDQVFFRKNCKFKYYNMINSHKSKSSLSCLISLKVINDIIPYRVLTLYISKNSKENYKITPEHKELWNTLEKLSRYSYQQTPLRTHVMINQ